MMSETKDNLPTGRSWSKDEKIAFRKKPVWKKFTKDLIRERGSHCEMCSSHSKKKSSSDLDVHHLRPDWYDLLRPDLFKVLCTRHHELVEWMAIQLAMGGVPNQEAAMAWLGPFLPKVVRTVDRYMTKESMLGIDNDQ